tara:strand:+ start:2111 stop:2290 length:180 start_codon:yes stop_codon:yes gene_type:complete
MEKSKWDSDNILDSPRNFKEESKHENGNYMCRCRECDYNFIGHKRRLFCKICTDKESKK